MLKRRRLDYHKFTAILGYPVNSMLACVKNLCQHLYIYVNKKYRQVVLSEVKEVSVSIPWTFAPQNPPLKVGDGQLHVFTDANVPSPPPTGRPSSQFAHTVRPPRHPPASNHLFCLSSFPKFEVIYTLCKGDPQSSSECLSET